MSVLKKQCGFTLIEAVLVIAITGIVAAMVAVFLRAPIEGYMDAARRAELTDAADTAMRRLSREVRRALPNSVRITGDYLEFIPILSGGRYRDEGTETACAAGKPLAFNAADTCFEVLGPAIEAAAGDFVVIYNLGQCSNPGCSADCSLPAADAYEGCNRAQIAGYAANILQFGLHQFPFSSPSNRFHVVAAGTRAVTFACLATGVTADGNGTGRLVRYSNYGFNAVQATGGLGAEAELARNVEDCAFEYAPGLNQREGLVTIRLRLTRGGESVNLYNEVHVNNAP
jgi:MSHA biogenesis protein MshO